MTRRRRSAPRSVIVPGARLGARLVTGFAVAAVAVIATLSACSGNVTGPADAMLDAAPGV